MSSLDKWEVQKFVSTMHCTLEKWSGFICNRRYYTIALGLLKKEEEEEEERRMPNHDFFTLRSAYVY